MRKGVMFSFIMVFITMSILAMIALQNSLVLQRREQIFIETRINGMNHMHESMVKDIDKSLKIITRRAVNVAFSNATYVEANQPPQPLDEANETLAELILNGTIKNSYEPFMENATFTYWTNKIKELSILKGFNLDFEISLLEVKPYDYIHLLVKTELNINISDRQVDAEINRSVVVNSIVSLEGLEDPFYPMYSNLFGSNTIRRSPYIGNYTQLLLVGSGGNSHAYGMTTNDTGNFNEKILIVHNASEVPGLSNALGVISETDIVPPPLVIPYLVNSSALSLIQNGMNVLLDGNNGVNPKVWFIDNFIKDTENSYYHPSEEGPSYLDRLEGRFFTHDKYKQANKTIGLESFVNKLDLYYSGATIIQEKTNVDYIYFSTSSPTFKKVKGLDKLTPDPYFRIDDEHKGVYNVTDLVY